MWSAARHRWTGGWLIAAVLFAGGAAGGEPGALGYRHAFAELGEVPVYGQVRLPAAAGEVRIVFGPPGGDRHEILVAGARVSTWDVRGGQRTEALRVYASAEPASTLEFSRAGGSLGLYRGGVRLGAVTNLPPGPLAAHTFSPGQEAKVFVHRRGPVLAQDDFARETVGREDAWSVQSGWWRTLHDSQFTASPNPFVCAGSADRSAGLLLTGHVFWNDLEIAVSLKPGGPVAEAGVVFAFHDPQNFLRATLRKETSGGSLRVVRMREGSESVAGVRPIVYPAGRWTRLSVRCREGGAADVRLDGVPLVSADVSGLDTFGKVGLYVRDGTASFDDFLAESALEARPEAPARVGVVSKTYARKPWEKQADDYLFRWARSEDVWGRADLIEKGVRYRGQFLRLPLFGEFEFSAAAAPAAGQFQLRDWLGAPLHTLDLPAGASIRVARRDSAVRLGDRTLLDASAGQGLSLGFLWPPGAAGRLPVVGLQSTAVRQELFENATVDWLPVGGQWDNTSRWKCDPQWAFFSGYGHDDVALFSKHRFEGNQVHEFYFGMKDVFGRAYELRRYALHDVNVSFLTDGVNLFSGYTFLYGGFDNRASYLFRGATCVATNAGVRFKEFKNRWSIFDEHLYWRPIRVERVGARIRVFFDDSLVFDWTDPSGDAPAGGHLALWTHRNGVMVGRLNSSAEAVRPDAAIYYQGPVGREDLPWRPVDASRVCVEPAGQDRVRVTNRFGGGEFAVRHVFEKAVDLREEPVLSLAVDIPEGVRVNLHARINGRYLIWALTAPLEETYRALGDESALPPNTQPEWWLLVNEALGSAVVRGQPGRSRRGTVQVNLLEEIRKTIPDAEAYGLDLLAVGNTSHRDYLMEGLSGNAAGARYELGLPMFGR